VFDKIFDIAKIAKFSKEERAFYEANMMNQRDQYAALKCAKEEGEAKGREEVFSLLRQGYSVDEAEKMLAMQNTPN
jgi:hypothetical protein